MGIEYTPNANEDLRYWVKTGNKQVLKKIAQLVESIMIDPTTGIGKPEQLKYELTEHWSRRIDKEHRMIYKVEDNLVKIFSLKGHYK